jgi:hypothetical protein
VVENKALVAYNVFTLAVATFYTAQAVAACVLTLQKVATCWQQSTYNFFVQMQKLARYLL